MDDGECLEIGLVVVCFTSPPRLLCFKQLIFSFD